MTGAVDIINSTLGKVGSETLSLIELSLLLIIIFIHNNIIINKYIMTGAVDIIN